MTPGTSTAGQRASGSQASLLPSLRIYTPQQEAAHDKWRARIAQETEIKKDQTSALIPRAMAGDPEAQGILRAVGGSVGSSDSKSANAWAGNTISSATMSMFGLSK